MVSPILLHLSLLSVKGYVMWVENLGQGPRDLTGLHTTGLENPIDRNDLLLLGVMLDDLAGIATDRLFQYAAAKLRNSFDAIWNAARFDRSLHYNDNGEWNGQLNF